jgi:hypothetical protein
MNNIDFSKYKRFFAFGCSFTDYWWPTWANIIAQEIPNHYIYARPGAGNHYIYQAVIEAHTYHKFTNDDLVIVMFTNVSRDDKFVKSRGWITPGNLYHQGEYDMDFVNKYLCNDGYLMRDLALVQGIDIVLNSIGCDYDLLSMIPFDSESSDNKRMTDVGYIFEFYKAVIEKIKPSVFDIVFNNDWNSKPHRPRYKVGWQKDHYVDNHPTPAEHLQYLKLIYPNLQLSQQTLDFVDQFNNLVLADNYRQELSHNNYPKNIFHRLGESLACEEIVTHP